MWQMVAGKSMPGGVRALVVFARWWTRSHLDVASSPEKGSFSLAGAPIDPLVRPNRPHQKLQLPNARPVACKHAQWQPKRRRTPRQSVQVFRTSRCPTGTVAFLPVSRRRTHTRYTAKLPLPEEHHAHCSSAFDFTECDPHGNADGGE